MTAARAERTGTIPNRSWPSQGRMTDSHIVVGDTAPADYGVLIAVKDDDATVGGVVLVAEQLRELAADLIERAELLDNVAGRHRRTPNWHIREGEKRLGTARHLLDHGMDPQVANAEAAVAAAHFQAAQAKQNRRTSAPHPSPEGTTAT